jgi:hypothetical protein
MCPGVVDRPQFKAQGREEKVPTSLLPFALRRPPSILSLISPPSRTPSPHIPLAPHVLSCNLPPHLPISVRSPRPPGSLCARFPLGRGPGGNGRRLGRGRGGAPLAPSPIPRGRLFRPPRSHMRCPARVLRVYGGTERGSPRPQEGEGAGCRQRVCVLLPLDPRRRRLRPLVFNPRPFFFLLHVRWGVCSGRAKRL